jgi:hypothetical protein
MKGDSQVWRDMQLIMKKRLGCGGWERSWLERLSNSRLTMSVRQLNGNCYCVFMNRDWVISIGCILEFHNGVIVSICSRRFWTEHAE